MSRRNKRADNGMWYQVPVKEPLALYQMVERNYRVNDCIPKYPKNVYFYCVKVYIYAADSVCSQFSGEENIR